MLKWYPKLLNDIYLSEVYSLHSKTIHRRCLHQEYYGENVLHMGCVAEDASLVKWLLDIGSDIHRCGNSKMQGWKNWNQWHCIKIWWITHTQNIYWQMMNTCRVNSKYCISILKDKVWWLILWKAMLWELLLLRRPETIPRRLETPRACRRPSQDQLSGWVPSSWHDSVILNNFESKKNTSL